MHASYRVTTLVVLTGALLALPLVAQDPSVVDVDAIFSRFGPDTPGCTVGVSRDHEIVLERAYGMANLEYDVPLTTDSRIEGGSVSKQFTAAATVLLALEGELSFDDDIRTYVPELPDYGGPITIRHLLNHTSGLRDWGSVAGLLGWPRTTRAHDHGDVLDILSRQHALNYAPGEYYSYTNSGYNLQAIIAARVSGMSFAEFSQQRLFGPLGLERTGWRDDYTRVEKNRATAYSPRGDGFRTNMPFENVHGNGGILTTVGDLLRWTWNLETGDIGGPRFVEEMHRQGVLNDGRTISYASGLFVGTYKGVNEVQHSGGTAGYNAYLTRFPDQGVAVAVLCNVSGAGAGGLAHRVADLYLGDAVTEPTPPTAVPVDAASLRARAGTYRSTRNGTAIELSMRGSDLTAGLGGALVPVGEDRFRRGGSTLVFEGPGRSAFVITDGGGDAVRYEPEEPFDPTPVELTEYTGAYHSDEVGTTYQVVIVDGTLGLVSRFRDPRPLRPLYRDTFALGGSTIRFLRSGAGYVTELSDVSGRVWDMRFSRIW